MINSYGFCVYHEIECDYEGFCVECPHNSEEDTKWFKEDELKELCSWEERRTESEE